MNRYCEKGDVISCEKIDPDKDFVVLSKEYDGGGYREGSYYPNGVKIIAKELGSNNEIEFYQSHWFSNFINFKDINLIGKQE